MVEFNRVIPDSDIGIYGQGFIGDKADQLVEKTATLRGIGFHTPGRVIIAEGFFDGFFRRNRLGDTLRGATATPTLARSIRRGSFAVEDFNALQALVASFGDTPLVVRSSAAGDARGTGIYQTEFSENRPDLVSRALQKVLASYFSESAIAFRRDAQTGEGFGIMIEPLIGQKIADDFDTYVFAPILSGFGYTSTSKGEGYVNVVPGIGGGVETRDGERLTRTDLKPYQGSLYKYIQSQRNRLISGSVVKRSALLGTNSFRFADFNGKAYLPPVRGGIVCQSFLAFVGNLKEAYFNVNFNQLFDRMERMERTFGRPQYFEWAMTLDGKQQRYWIVQIAGVDKKLDVFDFNDFGVPFLEGHTVTGSGIFESDLVAACMDGKGLDSLHKFNQNHRGYVLFYTGELTSKGQYIRRRALGIRELTYADVGNASVLIEFGNAGHKDSPLAHLQGQLDMTGKLFFLVAPDLYNTEFWNKWYEFWGDQSKKRGFRIVNKKVKVVGSERQNQASLYLAN